MRIRARVKKHAGQCVCLHLRDSAAGRYFAWFNGGDWFGISKFVDGFKRIVDIAQGSAPKKFERLLPL